VYADPVGFVPPYSLPSAGQVVTINGSSPEDGRPTEIASPRWNYALWNSYGAGVMVEDYSAGGAYVLAANGGHAHGEITGAAVLDFSTGTWTYLPHDNGGPASSANDYNFTNAEMTGAPYWEITGTNGLGGAYWVPGPPHPYQNLAAWPSSYGGGSKGSVVYVCRGAMGETGLGGSGAVHRFDLADRRWRRATDSVSSRNPAGGNGTFEGSAILDAARGRVWHVPQNQFAYTTVEYFDLNTSSFGVSGAHTAPGVDLGNRQRIWMLSGYLFAQGDNGTLYVFDPDNATAGWRQCTVSGGPLPSRLNRFAHFPLVNKLYWINQQGGTTLTRLTPPADLINGTWVLDTYTLPEALPALDKTNDPGDAADQYGFLFYVPSIQRLAWISGGSNLVRLIYPE
jgi:hypothetical protein